MRIFIFLVLISTSNFANANSSIDAENEGEAVGILFGYLKEVDVYKFMCSKYAPEMKETISRATDDWMNRNNTIVVSLLSGLERTPENEVNELLEVAQKTSRNRIILFNKLSKTEQGELCSKMVTELTEDTVKQKYPLAIKHLSK
ncbi:hypothetical protein AB4238_22475 [Shewanella sp. 10N.286.45.A1]|uniref:hypothetical protein n=1 Tax=Shewanella sp. 10N.286.45.A1 TaxID=3229694 RepID=UPI0035515817